MIYIHIPFCRSFCTYCDFYSEVASGCHKAEESVLFEEYGRAVAAEALARRAEITDETNTLYIGGGTPSVLPLSVFRTILDALAGSGHGGPYKEFTVEVNPDDIVDKGPSYVEGLLRMGVTRISMGVQSFDDGILRWMNRRHDSDAARKAYHILEDAGVPDISIDLIFGLTQLSGKRWKDSLDSALDISSKGNLPHHISSYQLSVESGSALAKLVEKGLWQEAPDDLCSTQYGVLCETLASAGYHHYEISNFAVPGHEAIHNSAYWKHVPYVGLGPGAHSLLCSERDGFLRQWNASDLNSYLEAFHTGNFQSVTESETLTSDQFVLEHIMLALRTSEGLPAAYLEKHCTHSALSSALSSGNLIHLPSGNIRIPEERFFISDSIISDII